MNKIMIVGNVLKDVYLNLDERSEKFVIDKDGVRQLSIGFNASQHHFFRRNSSLGGAAVSLEVLTKLGISASISGSSLEFTGDGVNFTDAPGAYRYIWFQTKRPHTSRQALRELVILWSQKRPWTTFILTVPLN